MGKHIPFIPLLTCEAIEPIPAELYTADDPTLWRDALRARYGDDFDNDEGEGIARASISQAGEA